MFEKVRRILWNIVASRDPGQGMIEYGLIIALVAIVAIAGAVILGPSIVTLIGSITNRS